MTKLKIRPPRRLNRKSECLHCAICKLIEREFSDMDMVEGMDRVNEVLGTHVAVFVEPQDHEGVLGRLHARLQDHVKNKLEILHEHKNELH